MSADPISAVVAALKRADIIPDVLPESFVPTLLFSAVFPTGHEVLLGNELTREDALDAPAITLTPPTPGDVTGSAATYTAVLTDPDAPSRTEPKYRQFRHWVITGLAAPAAGTAETASAAALQAQAPTTPYRPPGPPPGTGLHRYTILVFQEPEGGVVIPDGAAEHGAALEERRHWDAVKFGERYNLKLVGANYFLVRSTE